MQFRDRAVAASTLGCGHRSRITGLRWGRGVSGWIIWFRVFGWGLWFKRYDDGGHLVRVLRP